MIKFVANVEKSKREKYCFFSYCYVYNLETVHSRANLNKQKIGVEIICKINFVVNFEKSKYDII